MANNTQWMRLISSLHLLIVVVCNVNVGAHIYDLCWRSCACERKTENTTSSFASSSGLLPMLLLLLREIKKRVTTLMYTKILLPAKVLRANLGLALKLLLAAPSVSAQVISQTPLPFILS